MARLRAVCYRTKDEAQPVGEFIARMDQTCWPKMDSQIERLSEAESDRPFLPPPHCNRATSELWELRCEVSPHEYGILYGVEGIYAVLLHAYAGLGRSRPRDAVQVGGVRWSDYRRRIRLGGDGADAPSPLGDFIPP